MKIKTIILTLGSLLSLSAFAYTPHIDRTQHNQERRIHQGVRSGELSRHEARELKRLQARIYHMERRAKADGIVTRAERRAIQQEQRRLNRQIYNKKHNWNNRY